MKEAANASHIILAAAQAGISLWRNNVGVLFNERGTPVRYGLLNESPAMNKRLKSSDYIGITPVLITPQMVGMTLGVFTAVETKAEGWQFNPNDERAVAQAAFHVLVQRAGGFAGFAASVGDLWKVVRPF